MVVTRNMSAQPWNSCSLVQELLGQNEFFVRPYKAKVRR